ncbi:MAG: ROK family protein [Clostridiales Family XIII bacterium]|jgi:glucokinase|nr:ROK family protein [Clostridiales Family XIII bacterium]
MHYNIGVDIGGTNIVAGLVDDAGRIRAKAATPTLAARGAEAIVADIVALARKLTEESGIPADRVGGVGVGVPGTANRTTGIVEYACNLNWTGVPLQALLSEALRLPIRLENDANAAAFGEYTAGAAEGCDSFIMITLGTGIGGGMVSQGRLIEGFNFAGMEVGHMVIDKGGRPCHCGRNGCFERYASASGLILTAKEYMERYPTSLLWDMAEDDPDRVDGLTPFEAMKRGDPAAKAIIDVYAADLACGVTNLINIFQPDRLAIGGGIAGQGETLLAPLRAIVARDVYSKHCARNTEIVAAVLGNDAGVIGAARLCDEKRR